MLYDLPTYLKKANRLNGVRQGEVVFNDDPLTLGYIKVKIPGLIEGEVDDLPWVAPQYEAGLGSSGGCQSHNVPILGSYVNVVFDHDDPYTLYYVGCTPTTGTKPNDLAKRMPASGGIVDETNPNSLKMNRGIKPTELSADYPFTSGHVDDQGTGVVINRKTGEYLFGHGSGLRARINNLGTLDVFIPYDLKLKIGKNAEIDVKELLTVLAKNRSDKYKETHKEEADVIASHTKTATVISSKGGTSIDGKPVKLN